MRSCLGHSKFIIKVSSSSHLRVDIVIATALQQLAQVGGVNTQHHIHVAAVLVKSLKVQRQSTQRREKSPWPFVQTKEPNLREEDKVSRDFRNG